MEARYYSTSDLDLAAYLMLRHKVQSFFKDGLNTYQFEESPELREDIQNFLNNIPITFPPRAFAENLRRLRIDLAIKRKGGGQR